MDEGIEQGHIPASVRSHIRPERPPMSSPAGVRGTQVTQRSETRAYYVYILASGRNGTLYVGVTNNIIRRVWEHRNGVAEGFTKKYRIHHLVYYEIFGDISAAIRREKKLKKYPRAWKLNLIQRENVEWRDLSESFTV